MNSKCGNCGGFLWEIAEEAPSQSRFKFYFVRCSMCKVAITALNYFDTNTEIENLKKAMLAMGSSLDDKLAVIDENVRRLFLK